jgi:uncharacterized protein (DUF1330 family)
MQVENKLNPDEAQLAGFMEQGNDAPIYMVNLLKFKDKAVYEDRRETDLSGQDAYAIYGRGVAQVIQSHGGKIVFGGEVTHLMLGAVEELWDQVAIAMYPSRKAMMEMVMSPEYQEIAVHRTAGLEGQLNIETELNPNMSAS